MAYFVCDEDGQREYATLKDALSDATESIEIYRENCDPEWPLGVEDISIYEAPSGCAYPGEDGKLTHQAKEFNRQPAEDGSGCDYWCDYRMEAKP